jgi:hypothetical protein
MFVLKLSRMPFTRLQQPMYDPDNLAHQSYGYPSDWLLRHSFYIRRVSRCLPTYREQAQNKDDAVLLGHYVPLL